MNKTDLSNKKSNGSTPSNARKSLSDTEASSLRQNPRKAGRVFMAPMPGFTYNPLLKLQPNGRCPCRSGKKFKVCCLNSLPQVVPLDVAKQYKEQIARGNLTFVTKENEEALRKARDMQLYFSEADRKRREAAATEPPAEVTSEHDLT